MAAMAALQLTVGQTVRFGVEAQESQNEPMVALTTAPAGLEATGQVTFTLVVSP